ncbi:MAG: type II secretion system protein [bacterium]
MRGSRGFTLIEIMIVLSIVAIGLVMAIPNLQRWMSRTNAQGFEREVFSELQGARIRSSSGTVRYRLVFDFGAGTTSLQVREAGGWSPVRGPAVQAPFGAGFVSITPSGGAAVTSGLYAFVFNPSGEVYAQSDTADDGTIASIDNAVIRLTGANLQDTASILLYGWTGKARLN